MYTYVRIVYRCTITKFKFCQYFIASGLRLNLQIFRIYVTLLSAQQQPFSLLLLYSLHSFSCIHCNIQIVCDIDFLSLSYRRLQGTPIIIIPASKGFSMICELLLENGANPNMKDKVIITLCDVISSLSFVFLYFRMVKQLCMLLHFMVTKTLSRF